MSREDENYWEQLDHLELGGFSVGEVERLEDVDDQRHQVLHNILVVPGQVMIIDIVLENWHQSRGWIVAVKRSMKGLWQLWCFRKWKCVAALSSVTSFQTLHRCCDCDWLRWRWCECWWSPLQHLFKLFIDAAREGLHLLVHHDVVLVAGVPGNKISVHLDKPTHRISKRWI